MTAKQIMLTLLLRFALQAYCQAGITSTSAIGESNPETTATAIVGPNPAPKAIVESDSAAAHIVGPKPSHPAIVGSDQAPPTIVGSEPAPPIIVGSEPAPPTIVGPDPAATAFVGSDQAPPAIIGPSPAVPAIVGSDPAPPAIVGHDPAVPAIVASDSAPPAIVEPEPKTSAITGPNTSPPVIVGPDSAIPAIVGLDPGLPALGKSGPASPAIGDSGPAPPAIDESESTPPAISTSRQAPPAIGESEPAPPAIGASEPAPPVVGALGKAPPAIGESEPTPPAIGASGPAPPAIGASEQAPPAISPLEPAPPVVGASEPAPSAIGASVSAPPSIGELESAPSAVSASEPAQADVGSSESAPQAVGAAKPALQAIAASESAPPALGASEPSPPAIGASESAPSTIGASEPAPPANDASKPAPPGIGKSEPAPPPFGASESKPSAVGASIQAPPAIGTSEPAPQAPGASKSAPQAIGASEPAPNIRTSEPAPPAISASEPAPPAIGASEPAPSAVGASEPAPPAIGASESAPPTIGASEPAPPAKGASEPAPQAIGASELPQPAIGASESAPPAILTSEPAPPAIGALEPTPSTVTASEPAASTASASESAPSTVGGSEPAPPAVGASEPAPPVVGASEPTPPAIGASEPAPQAIGASEPVPPAIGASKLAAPAIEASEPAPHAIGASEPAPPAISASEPALPAIYASELAPPDIGESEPVSLTIGESESAPPAIGASEPAPSAIGASEPAPSVFGSSEPAPPAFGASAPVSPTFGASEQVPQANKASEQTPSDIGTSDPESPAIGLSKPANIAVQSDSEILPSNGSAVPSDLVSETKPAAGTSNQDAKYSPVGVQVPPVAQNEPSVTFSETPGSTTVEISGDFFNMGDLSNVIEKTTSATIKLSKEQIEIQDAVPVGQQIRPTRKEDTHIETTTHAFTTTPVLQKGIHAYSKTEPRYPIDNQSLPIDVPAPNHPPPIFLKGTRPLSFLPEGGIGFAQNVQEKQATIEVTTESSPPPIVLLKSKTRPRSDIKYDEHHISSPWHKSKPTTTLVEQPKYMSVSELAEYALFNLDQDKIHARQVSPGLGVQVFFNTVGPMKQEPEITISTKPNRKMPINEVHQIQINSPIDRSRIMSKTQKFNNQNKQPIYADTVKQKKILPKVTLIQQPGKYFDSQYLLSNIVLKSSTLQTKPYAKENPKMRYDSKYLLSNLDKLQITDHRSAIHTQNQRAQKPTQASPLHNINNFPLKQRAQLSSKRHNNVPFRQQASYPKQQQFTRQSRYLTHGDFPNQKQAHQENALPHQVKQSNTRKMMPTIKPFIDTSHIAPTTVNSWLRNLQLKLNTVDNKNAEKANSKSHMKNQQQGHFETRPRPSTRYTFNPLQDSSKNISRPIVDKSHGHSSLSSSQNEKLFQKKKLRFEDILNSGYHGNISIYRPRAHVYGYEQMKSSNSLGYVRASENIRNLPLGAGYNVRESFNKKFHPEDFMDKKSEIITQTLLPKHMQLSTSVNDTNFVSNKIIQRNHMLDLFTHEKALPVQQQQHERASVVVPYHGKHTITKQINKRTYTHTPRTGTEIRQLFNQNINPIKSTNRNNLPVARKRHFANVFPTNNRQQQTFPLASKLATSFVQPLNTNFFKPHHSARTNSGSFSNIQQRSENIQTVTQTHWHANIGRYSTGTSRQVPYSSQYVHKNVDTPSTKTHVSTFPTYKTTSSPTTEIPTTTSPPTTTIRMTTTTARTTTVPTVPPTADPNPPPIFDTKILQTFMPMPKEESTSTPYTDGLDGKPASWDESSNNVNTSFDMRCSECVFVNDRCLLPDPSYCHMYTECVRQGTLVRAFSRECALGSFFDRKSFLCVDPKNADCPQDRCRTPGTKWYSIHGHCKHYWACGAREGGGVYAQSECCPDMGGFMEGEGCVQNPNCTDSCESRVQLSDPKGCNLKKTASPTVYFDENANMERPCAPGTLFNQLHCTCVQDVTLERNESRPGGINCTCINDTTCACRDASQASAGANTCLPKLQLRFEGGTIEDSSHTKQHIGIEGVPLTHTGEAIFNGAGRLVLWRHANLMFPLVFAVRLKFQSTSSGPRYQTLISNCNKKAAMEATFDISIDTVYHEVVFKVNTYQGPAKMFKIMYQQHKWTSVDLIYDGERVVGSVDGRSRNILAGGGIESRPKPLGIGSCGGKGGIKGLMDDIYIYEDCIPDEMYGIFMSVLE